ncbi:hypothetical protein BX666DRAFT_1875789 [Dichotomocladium elegans]|nr:hypothetical protein BX666DRAFT_1875789 [Dichotomocladium elegans]
MFFFAMEHDEYVSSHHQGVKRRSDSMSSLPSECSDDSIGGHPMLAYIARIGLDKGSTPGVLSIKITKDEALTYLKNVMSLKQPVTNNNLYEQLFADSTRLRFGPLKNTPRQIETWISKSNLWGNRHNLRQGGTQVEGRLLWIVQDKYLEVNVMSDLVKYRTQLRNHPMTNIGYARKSPGKERFEQVRKFHHWLQWWHESIEIVTAEPNDVRHFFERYTQVEQLVIDHGLTFEIFESRFDCRSTPKHRSVLSHTLY